MSACAASCGVANDFGGKGDVETCCPANAATARIDSTQTATSTKAMIFEIFNVIRAPISRGLDYRRRPPPPLPPPPLLPPPPPLLLPPMLEDPRLLLARAELPLMPPPPEPPKAP